MRMRKFKFRVELKEKNVTVFSSLRLLTFASLSSPLFELVRNQMIR